MKANVATTLAFLIAPLFAAIALLILGAVHSDHELEVSAFGWGGIFYCYTLAAALIVGAPCYFLLKRFDRVTWWSATLVGLFSGAVMELGFKPLNVSVLLIGGLSGLVFWLVWRSGRAQRSLSH